MVKLRFNVNVQRRDNKLYLLWSTWASVWWSPSVPRVALSQTWSFLMLLFLLFSGSLRAFKSFLNIVKYLTCIQEVEAGKEAGERKSRKGAGQADE